MSSQLTIQYREFYDVPRMFVVSSNDQRFLLDCPFSDELEDYESEYTVYMLDDVTVVDSTGSWEKLPQVATKVGTVPVADVEFDPTFRATIDSALFSKFNLDV